MGGTGFLVAATAAGLDAATSAIDGDGATGTTSASCCAAEGRDRSPDRHTAGITSSDATAATPIAMRRTATPTMPSSAESTSRIQEYQWPIGADVEIPNDANHRRIGHSVALVDAAAGPM
jgi:hypothetical protein